MTIDVDTKKFTYLLIFVNKLKSSEDDLNDFDMHVGVKKPIPLHCYKFL